jgi:sensor histidine kinase YesM
MPKSMLFISHALFWIFSTFIVSRLFGIETVEVLETHDGEMEIITYDDHFIWATIVTSICGMILTYTNIFYLAKTYFGNGKLRQFIGNLLVFFSACVLVNGIINRFLIYGAETMDSFYSYPSLGLHISLLLFYLACSFAYAFTMEWYKNNQLKNQLVQEQLSTELNYLKSQINPHFLFNTLNNLYSIAQEKKVPELEEGIGELSNLMRYMLYESNTPKVPLSKEISNLESFIEIQKLRIDEDEILVNFQVNGSVHDSEIAPMILIPFVENAFKHGISFGKSSIIHILLEVTDIAISFKVKNKIHRESNMKDRNSGIGLENVKRRLQLIYPDHHILSIDENEEYYWIDLKIDKHV